GREVGNIRTLRRPFTGREVRESVVDLDGVDEKILSLVGIADDIVLVQNRERFRRQRSIVFNDALDPAIGVACAQNHSGITELVLEANQVLVEVFTTRALAERMAEILS